MPKITIEISEQTLVKLMNAVTKCESEPSDKVSSMTLTKLEPRNKDEIDPFTEHLFCFLKEKDITESTLSRLLSMPKQSLNSSLCRPSQGPRIALIRRIRDALGCTWEDLLGE